MSELFSNYSISNLQLKNRFVRSATTSYWSNEEGILRQPILDYYKKLAAGGFGLIVKGHSYISKEGKAHTGQSGLAEEKHLPKMKELVELVHSEGAAIVAQLNHAGYAAKADRVTASEYKTDNWSARKATIDDIKKIISDFAQAAEFAIQAGFDGVQIHAAHGYLISQFLSDNVNQRQDEYGGSLENRARLLLETLQAVRTKIGSKAIIGVKMNTDDFSKEKGIQITDAIKVASWLVEKGINFIELSGGGPKQDRATRNSRGRTTKEKAYYEAHFAGHAEKIRAAQPDIPLVLVNGIRTKGAMEALIKEGVVDLIAMSKPAIIEPDIPNRLHSSQKKSACIDCNKCTSRDVFGKMMLECHHIKK